MISHSRSIIREKRNNPYLEHMKRLLSIFSLAILLLMACTQSNTVEKGAKENAVQLELNLEQVELLVQLPLSCIDIRYPN